MSDTKNDLNDLAAQYMDLWQKQMLAQSSERVVEDALKSTQAMNEQMGEMMKSFDSPEKVQNWMTTWAESWKAQIEKTTGQPTANPFWPPTAGTASGNDQHNVAELEKRLATLEERVLSLESQLKK
ncbi:MAG: hypothetical protein HWE30_00655 [Methylocystaceae bacterium]|nr:hypothetical protein [Methylocystaceae bacterium]